MNIITPNQDPALTDPATGRIIPNEGMARNASRVAFESVLYDTTEPARKPSLLSRFFKFLGGLAPLAYIAAPFTLGTSLAAGAGLQALGNLGTTSIAKHNAKEGNAQAANSRQPLQVSYPGMMPGASMASDPTMAVIASRDAAAIDAVHR